MGIVHSTTGSVEFKKTNNFIGKEVVCNILIEFCIPMKLVRLI